MSEPNDTRLSATPAGVTLGALEIVADGGARAFVLQMRAGRFHGFVIRRGQAVWGYVDRCPHMGLPLAQVLDDYLTPDRRLIACSWHSALFDVETGACQGGPCGGLALSPWPVHVANGVLKTGQG